MADDELDVDLGREQLGTGVLAGVAAYVVGFLVSFLPGPIANPRVFPPEDVVNATINTTERPQFEDTSMPLTETIDSFSSAGGVFYNAHFVEIVFGNRPGLTTRTNVLLAEHANASTTLEAFPGDDFEIVLAGLPIPPVLLFAVPVLLLALGGYLVNDRTRETLPTPETAVVSGIGVGLGYLPPVAIGAAMIRFRNSQILLGGIDLVGAIIVAGIVYPVTFGGLGGYVWYRSRRRDVEAEGSGSPASDASTDPGVERGAADSSAGEATTRVAMTDGLAFEPGAITIEPGDAVTWENAGSITFTVTAYEDRIPPDAAYFASGGFDSEETAREAYPGGGIAAGDSYSHTFETPGTYEYFCVPQEDAGMTGTVEVREWNPRE